MTATDARTAASVGAARRAMARRFRAAGLDAPELDARLLTALALGLDHAGLIASAERPLAAGEQRAIDAVAVRRLAREPVARIVGMREFWGLPFRVTPAVLVPRPETETVVEAALAAVEDRGARHRNLRIADIGTGSGALLLALLSELASATGIGTDLSAAALAVARDNARRLGLAARAAFVCADHAAALTGSFDLIVANPPYVASPDLGSLAPEVRDHDPRLALDGGEDGLAAYRRLADEAGRVLAPDGDLILEVGAGQASAVVALFAARGLATLRPAKQDLAGVARALHIGFAGVRASP